MRKLLGRCSLQAFSHGDLARLLDADRRDNLLPRYVDGMAQALRACTRSARAEAPANSYGESVIELALSLVCELQLHQSDWAAFVAACVNEHAKIGSFWHDACGPAILRKKFNDMYAGLRDKVDSDNYQVACGRPCSANKIATYRMLDTAWADIARLLAAWHDHGPRLSAILGRDIGAGSPAEARQIQSVGACKAEWIIRWSQTNEQFTGRAGPLHTRSKRFSSLRNAPDKIQEMLREIGDYEELSSNRDRNWLHDASEAAEWLDDYWRVLAQSESGANDGPDQLLAAPEPEVDDDDPQDRHGRTALALADDSLPVRLSVFAKMLGGADDAYPAEWLDPATGALPTMQQLAGLDRISLPTLRKRRDSAIARLLAAAARP